MLLTLEEISFIYSSIIVHGELEHHPYLMKTVLQGNLHCKCAYWYIVKRNAVGRPPCLFTCQPT